MRYILLSEENAYDQQDARKSFDMIAFAGVLLALSGFLIWFVATLPR